LKHSEREKVAYPRKRNITNGGSVQKEKGGGSRGESDNAQNKKSGKEKTKNERVNASKWKKTN